MRKLLKTSSSLIILATLFLFSGCQPYRILVSEVPPQEVRDIQLFSPFSFIYLVERSNNGSFSDSLSQQSEQMLKHIAKGMRAKLPISGEITVEDTNLRYRLITSLDSVVHFAYTMKSLEQVRIPVLMDSILEARQKRFGMFLVGEGFTRVKGNYGKQAVKGAAMGVLTLGMYYQVPIKCSSTVYAVIADAENDEIAFVRRSFGREKEPLDEEVLKTQLELIFEGYFYPEQ